LYPAGSEDFVRFNIVSENVLCDNSKDGTHGHIKLGKEGVCSFNQISNNIFRESGSGNYGGGIGGAYANSHNNTIEGNTFINIYSTPIALKGENNTVKNNDIFTVRKDYGILLYLEANGTTVVGNTIIDVQSHGIFVISNSNQISGNTINDVGSHGIYFANSSYSLVEANRISNVGSEGINLNGDSDYNFLQGNYIVNTGQCGIEIVSADCNVTVIHGNVMLSITTANEISDGGTRTEIHANYQDEDGWVA